MNLFIIKVKLAMVSLSIEQLLNIKCWTEERNIGVLRLWHYPIEIVGVGQIDI